MTDRTNKGILVLKLRYFDIPSLQNHIHMPDGMVHDMVSPGAVI